MKRLHISLLCGSAVLAISAQSKDLKTEITVDRTVVPVEREAVRLGSLTPQLLSSPVNMRRLTLADYTETAPLTRSVPVLGPASYGDKLSLSPYKGYAALGYFPAFNLGASAGYKFVDTEHTRLGAWLQYDGYSYKPSDKTDGSYANNTFTLGARLEQRVGKSSSFAASLGYTFAAIGKPDAFAEEKQNVNDFDINLSWWSRVKAISYHAHASFDHFGYGKDGYVDNFKTFYHEDTQPTRAASENRFTFKAGIGYLGSSASPRGGLELSADFLSRSNGVEIADIQYGVDEFYPIVQPISDGTLGVISLTPYYAFHGASVNGRIGAKVELSTGGTGKKFHIAPAVMLDWNAASQFALYANIEGGERLNSLRSLFGYCPFINSIWQYQRSHMPVSVEIGMNIGPFSGFSARIFGGYAVANDWLMPQSTTMFENGEPPLDCGPNFDCGPQRLYSFTNFGYYDLKSWHAGVGLSYEWRSVVKVNATAETAPNDADKSYYLWRDRAKYVINASIEVRPVKALKIGVGYELRAGRRNYASNDIGAVALRLANVSNLGVNASYDINESITVFARGENILNRRYELVTDIEAQGVKGLIGATYKF